MKSDKLISQEALKDLMAKAKLGKFRGLKKTDQIIQKMMTGEEKITTRAVIKLITVNKSAMKKNVYREVLLMYLAAIAMEYNLIVQPSYLGRGEAGYQLSILQDNLLIKLNEIKL